MAEARETMVEGAPRGLPPQDKRHTKVQGYCTLVNNTGGDLFPRQTCSWGRRRLRPGENVVNKNIIDDWTASDPAFAQLLRDGEVEIGADFQPLAELEAQRSAAASGDLAELRRTVAEQQMQIDALLRRLEPPKKGK